MMVFMLSLCLLHFLVRQERAIVDLQFCCLVLSEVATSCRILRGRRPHYRCKLLNCARLCLLKLRPEKGEKIPALVNFWTSFSSLRTHRTLREYSRFTLSTIRMYYYILMGFVQYLHSFHWRYFYRHIVLKNHLLTTDIFYTCIYFLQVELFKTMSYKHLMKNCKHQTTISVLIHWFLNCKFCFL